MKKKKTNFTLLHSYFVPLLAQAKDVIVTADFVQQLTNMGEVLDSGKRQTYNRHWG